MPIVKLVCQGCGANLDALDNQRVMQCGYCGTTNQIKQTVYQQPAPPIQQPTPVYQQPHVQPINFQQVRQAQARSSRAVLVVVLISALLPLVIGGFVAYMTFSAANEALDKFPGFAGGTISGPAAVNASKYRWESERPFAADVDGDGVDDLIGLVQPMGATKIRLVAMSGSGWTPLWETELGDRSTMPGRPMIHFEPATKLILFPLGAALTAYDGRTGSQRWISNMSDAVEQIAVDGDTLWVWTIDKQRAAIHVGDGKPAADAGQPSAQAVRLRDTEGYELIPTLRTLDLDSDEFADLRVQAAFCPSERLPLEFDRSAAFRGQLQCSFPHGLAWATRDKGTQVPFLLGYERKARRKDKASERWRVQLTTPGSLETVDSGFNQPRAELFGDDALVSSAPKDKLEIRRISLLDGSSKWQATLSAGAGDHLTGMTLGEDRLFATVGGIVHVFALDTGAKLAELGDW